MKNEQKEQELKFKEVYLDANLFVYAAISTEQQGESARKMLEEIERGNYEAYTAALMRFSGQSLSTMTKKQPIKLLRGS